jgi:hypothetical protein
VFDILAMMQMDKDSDNLMCFTELRKKENRWRPEDLSCVVTGTVRGTFGVQLSSWLMSTAAEHATYAAMKRGKSGFYKCVNSHMRPFHEGVNLSTEDAQSKVIELVARLSSCGFSKSVNTSWVDQNFCCWIHQLGRNDGKDGRKNDVIFFSRNHFHTLPTHWASATSVHN